MIPAYIAAAFTLGLVVGAVVTRPRVRVKFGSVEIECGSAGEVIHIFSKMKEYAKDLPQKGSL